MMDLRMVVGGLCVALLIVAAVIERVSQARWSKRVREGASNDRRSA
jgi:hypothetical protein